VCDTRPLHAPRIMAACVRPAFVWASSVRVQAWHTWDRYRCKPCSRLCVMCVMYMAAASRPWCTSRPLCPASVNRWHGAVRTVLVCVRARSGAEALHTTLACALHNGSMCQAHLWLRTVLVYARVCSGAEALHTQSGAAQRRAAHCRRGC